VKPLLVEICENGYLITQDPYTHQGGGFQAKRFVAKSEMQLGDLVEMLAVKAKEEQKAKK
jgi:hypothetical protein